MPPCDGSRGTLRRFAGVALASAFLASAGAVVVSNVIGDTTALVLALAFVGVAAASAGVGGAALARAWVRLALGVVVLAIAAAVGFAALLAYGSFEGGFF